MAANNEKTRLKDSPDRPSPKKASSKKAAQGHVGDALRSIYQNTVEEEVPQDFLDILGKLA